MRPLRIAHLTTVDSSLRYLLLPQLMEIRERGGVPIGISADGPDVPFLLDAGIEFIPLTASTRSRSLASDIKAAWQLRGVIKSSEIDVLHTHNPKPGLYGRVLGRLMGVPIVVNTVHGLYASEQDPLWKRVIVYVLEAFAALFSDFELVQSSEDVDLMRRMRIGRRSSTRYLGNGIDLDRFSPARHRGTRSRMRKSLGVEEDRVVVGTVARLVAEKGLPELIEAWGHRQSDYDLIVVGPPDPTKADALTDTQIEAAERAGIRFLGHREDVDELYAAWDVFVLPSHREGFPRAAMEAAASGLPIVATDIRGCREVVEDGQSGILVPRLSPSELSAAIDRMVDDASMRTQMGSRGLAKAKEEFDERAVVARVFDAYCEVALRKGRADIYAALTASSLEGLTGTDDG